MGLAGRCDRQADAQGAREARGSKSSAWPATFAIAVWTNRRQTRCLDLERELGAVAGRDARKLFVRSEQVGTAGFIDEIQQAIWSVNGSVPLGRVQTMGEVYQRSTARTSLTLVLLSITGAMALALGLVGIYGVISYMFTQRTREIGVRMALGARNAALKRLLLSQVLAVVAVGVALGLAGRRS